MKVCKLNLHPTKTKIVYCKCVRKYDKHPIVKIDFLGYILIAIESEVKMIRNCLIINVMFIQNDTIWVYFLTKNKQVEVWLILGV